MTARQPDPDDLGGEPSSFDLRDYAQILRRHVVLIVVATILGVIAAAGYAVLSGHSYVATAQVLVPPPTQGPGSSSSTQQAATQANMTTEQAIAQSPPVALEAAKLLHVPPLTLQAAAAKRLTVTVPATTLTTSNVLQIAWKGKSPALAQAGANAFAEAYLSYKRQLLASQISRQTASLRRGLASVQQQITTVHIQLLRTHRSPLHTTLALKFKQLESAQAAYNSKLSALTIANIGINSGSLLPAARPLTSAGLSHKLIAVLGALVGLLIGLVLAFVRDAFDDRIWDATQFEQKLGAPTLAVLPPDVGLSGPARETGNGARRRRSSTVMTAPGPDRPVAEATRSLRAMLVPIAVRRQLRTLLVVAADTSVSAGQLAAVLGVALTESGRRVLLVAADMRGSVLPEIFDVSNNVGLSDLLASDHDPKALLSKSRQVVGMVQPGHVARQLTVLPPGPQDGYALALLDSPAMEQLLEAMRQTYDFVLLDSPPVTTAADAYALAANVDGVIVVARGRHTRGRTVEELSRRLDRIGAVLVGGVFIANGPAGKRQERRRGAEPSRGGELARSVRVADAEGERARL